MRIAVYLPNTKYYIERVRMFDAAATHFDEIVLFTNVNITLTTKHLKIIPLQLENRWKYPGALSLRVSNKILRSGQFDIIHDSFGHLLPLFMTHRDVFKITSLSSVGQK